MKYIKSINEMNSSDIIDEIKSLSFILEDENIGYAIENRDPKYIIINLFNRGYHQQIQNIETNEAYLEFIDRLSDVCEKYGCSYHNYPRRKDILIITLGDFSAHEMNNRHMRRINGKDLDISGKERKRRIKKN